MVLDQAGLDACCRYLLKCKDVKLKGHWEPYLKYAETHAVLQSVCVCVVHGRHDYICVCMHRYMQRIRTQPQSRK